MLRGKRLLRTSSAGAEGLVVTARERVQGPFTSGPDAHRSEARSPSVEGLDCSSSSVRRSGSAASQRPQLHPVVQHALLRQGQRRRSSGLSRPPSGDAILLTKDLVEQEAVIGIPRRHFEEPR